MIIKKYTGKTEAEATDNAKKELGDDVVVMNVKEVKPKGFLSFLKPKYVEVTVAKEEERERFSPIRKDTSKVAETQETVAQNTQTAMAAEKKIADTASIEEKLESLQNLLESKLQGNEGIQAAQVRGMDLADTEALEEKGEDLEEKDEEYLKFVKILYNMLLDNEVDEHYANQLIDGLDKNYKPGQNFDHLLAGIYQRLILKFGKPEKIEPAKQGPKVVIFIGPTGVGKTTTIAKVASRFAIEEKKKVALFTADTYRIAAAEQLKTYAGIMQVPFRVIYSEEDMVEALKDFYSYDYIFVDTMGHSHRNDEQRECTAKLVESVKGLAEFQCYLVLSATTKYKDLLKIVDNYKTIADYQLIFTKLDETYTLGNLLNLRMYTKASIAYVTCGQNVPEDIEVFDPQKTVKLLLGGKKQ